MGRLLPQAVFTITWLACSTYLIASLSYRNTDYVIQHSDAYIANLIMYVSCLITIVLAVIGCVCVKSNINHLCGIGLFCLLVCTLIPTACIYGLVTLRQVRKINEPFVKNEVVQYYRIHKELYPLLIAVQRDQGCCGLYSPMDYREFIYNRDTCKLNKQDIPESCLKLNEIYRACVQGKNTSMCSASPYFENAIVFLDEALNKELQAINGDEQKSQYKCEKVTSRNAKLDLDGFRKKLIWNSGCIQTIIENSMALRDTHYFFFYLIMIFAVVMLASFVTHWLETVPTRHVIDDDMTPEDSKAGRASVNPKMSRRSRVNTKSRAQKRKTR